MKHVIAVLVVILALMLIPVVASASSSTTLLYDHFDGSAVNTGNWHIPTWRFNGDGTYVGRTQFRCVQNSPLPSVSKSTVDINVQTDNIIGLSMYGYDLISNQMFKPVEGITVTVRAKMDDIKPGTVGGIFLYSYNPGTGMHDEIDFEILGNDPGRIHTNIYANDPFGVGDPEAVSYSTGTAADWHVYEIRWEPDRAEWYVDGVLIRTETSNVPAGPMYMHLNMWAPDSSWTEAYSDEIQPVWDASDNEVFSMSVDSVLVTEEKDKPPTIIPIAGSTRITTAIEASKKAYPAGASNVVIATAMNWPDALGGSALAGVLDAPILLTYQGSLSSEVISEITRLGASRAYILGGTGAISSSVQSSLNSLFGPSNVERIGGRDRYETANMIAARTISILKAGSGYDGTAFVTTGQNFPDALGASPLAAAKGWPIYLASPARGASTALVATMKNEGITRAIVLGGTAAVSASVSTELSNELRTSNVERVGGRDRYATCIKVATYGVSNAGLVWDEPVIATGQNFPDALTGGVLQGRTKSVLLLTPTSSLHPGVASILSTNKATITEVRILGGTAAISTTVRMAVRNALK